MAEQRLTARQAAIIGCYTGVSAGDFGDVHELIEKLLGRPVWTHELAEKAIWAQIKAAATPLFLSICVESPGSAGEAS